MHATSTHGTPSLTSLPKDEPINEIYPCNKPFSYSEKESQSNDTLLHFVEVSNVQNSDRSSNATRSNLVYKMYKNNARSRLF